MAGQPRWQQVGGSAAEVYERHLVPAMFAPWAPRLIEAADLRPAGHVPDIDDGLTLPMEAHVVVARR